MSKLLLRFACVTLVLGSPLAAQQVPSSAQARDLLQQAQQNPAMAEQLRNRLRQSGMTPDQIRSLLTSRGFPQGLLDAYLNPAAPGTSTPAPGSYELAAFQSLGVGVADFRDSLPVDTGFIRVPGGMVKSSRIFGVDAFRRTTTQFMPLLAGPAPPDYRLGPGDVLMLILTGDTERAYTLPVTREGFVLIPQVGQLFVSNLTLDQLREVLYARLGQVYSGIRRTADAKTHFDVTVTNVRVNQVYVVGEVTQQGTYQISSLGTIMTALYAAGGVTDRANLRAVELQRAGKTIMTFDLYEYLVQGMVRSDVRLESGDVIFVPVHQTRAEISGAVVRPAIYELKPGETLVDLVRTAGGFTSSAALKRVAIHRILPMSQQGPAPASRAIVDVQLSVAPATRDGQVAPSGGVVIPPLVIQPGDSIVVDSVPSLAGLYYVSVAGMINKPGIYPWREGMTLRELVLLGRGPKVGAYLKDAEIARMPENRGEGNLAATIRVPLDSTYLFERDSSGRYLGPPGLPFPAPGAPEVELKPFDNVLIFRQPDFELQRSVTIQGEVRYPGTYALRTKSDRLADLVERAGGLMPQAYPNGVQFIRAAGTTGRVNVDLPIALKDAKSRDNIILQPGDSIFIPEYVPTVKVSGAVNSPGSTLYRPGEGLDYYLSAAGGFARNADKGRVSVRYANGDTRTKSHFLWFSGSPTPQPGAEVLVPAKDASERHTDLLALLGAMTQIITSMVAVVVLVTKT